MKNIQIFDLKIMQSKFVYPISKDSIQLLNYLKRNAISNKKALDLGTGTGIVALFLRKSCNYVVATDISKKALKLAERNSNLNKISGIKWCHSDLLENINEKFDLIIFNCYTFLSRSEFLTYIQAMKTIVLSKLERVNNYLDNLIKNRQIRLLDFLNKVPNFLHPKGRLILRNRSDICRKPIFDEPLSRFKVTKIANGFFLLLELK